MSGAPENSNGIHPGYRALIVEDGDTKFRSVNAVVEEVLGRTGTRASTINAAEALLMNEHWDVVLLDISMDISSSASGPSGRGHANLGGLGIAYKMFLKRREAPTIIVTAHDAFEAADKKNAKTEIFDLKAIEDKARQYLGQSFIGHVRYGDAGWSRSLAALLNQVIHP